MEKQPQDSRSSQAENPESTCRVSRSTSTIQATPSPEPTCHETKRTTSRQPSTRTTSVQRASSVDSPRQNTVEKAATHGPTRVVSASSLIDELRDREESPRTAERRILQAENQTLAASNALLTKIVGKLTIRIGQLLNEVQTPTSPVAGGSVADESVADESVADETAGTQAVADDISEAVVDNSTGAIDGNIAEAVVDNSTGAIDGNIAEAVVENTTGAIDAPKNTECRYLAVDKAKVVIPLLSPCVTDADKQNRRELAHNVAEIWKVDPFAAEISIGSHKLLFTLEPAELLYDINWNKMLEKPPNRGKSRCPFVEDLDVISSIPANSVTTHVFCHYGGILKCKFCQRSFAKFGTAAEHHKKNCRHR